jgi:subtilisin family serine protease
MTRKIQKNVYRGRALGIAFGFMIIAFMLVSCAAALPAGTESYHGKEVAANEVLVKFHAATAEEIRNVQVREDVDEAEPVGSAGVMRFHSKSKNVDTLLSDLSGRADVEYAEPDYIVHAVLTPNDPSFGNLWGLNKISSPLAWDISTGSTADVAAVIDTGIDYTHPDLAANVWSAQTAYTVTIAGRSITCPAGSHGFNAITNTCDPMDDNSHGTHVSGTIGAVGNNGAGVAGVNWNTRIIGAKFLNKQGSGYTSDAINAIDFVIQTKQLTGANVRVLSNSWSGGGYSQALLDEINKANTNDMLFVAAAGNDGKDNDITPSYPASYAAVNVVAVAATDSTDSLASWSNWGKTTVNLAAPGVNIYSTIRNGGYAYYSGTSMATPHVSGAALLILSECNLDTAQLKTNILSNVDPVPSLNGKTVTGGRLNVNKAIRACSAPAIPTTTTFSALPVSSTYGGTVTFTATVSPAIATGTVTFYDGGSALGSGTLSGGTAIFTTSALSGGVHSITATYGGDSTFGGSTSSAFPYTVNKAASTTSLTSSVNPSTFGQVVTFTATVSPVATGTVTFYDGGSALGSGTLSSGTASYSTSSLSAGSHPITATYGGDSNVAGSTSSTLTQTVNSATAGDFSLSASPASRSVNPGSGTTYSVSITRSSGFTGPVTFGVSGLPAGASGTFNPSSTTGTSSKLSIKTLSTTPAGTCPLTITGTSGSLSHTTTVTLIVKQPRSR